MRVDGPPRDADPIECPYLPSKTFVQRHFFGIEANLDETAALQAAGWRRFGLFFFQPHCPGCQACRPVRIDAAALHLTPSQRQVWNKNADVEFSLAPLTCRDDYYEVYANHSRVRFGKDTSLAEFEETFFTPAVPGFVTEYRVGGRLAGLGICDEGADGISSVYFVFHEDFAGRSLGTYSVLRECALAVERGRRWYYLGYWVDGNATMAYKGRFAPRQVMDWDSADWT
jgi:arginyl-tRNA--protein-N-Asp/Glu arginylyltransferase